MSVLIPAEQFALPIARSGFIDACSIAESAVRARMSKLGLTADHRFAQNVEKLTKAPAGPQFSKKQRAALHEALAKLSDLWTLRCDVAHGTLSAVVVDDLRIGCITNPLKDAPYGRPAVLISAEELEAASKMARQLAREILPDVVSNA